jgi:ABC-type branched-subunit amino acid transport system substrate-binding protein
MSDDTFRIGMVIPFHGPSGIWGPSAQAATEFAVQELNETGGILGKPTSVVWVDGGRGLDNVSAELTQLIEHNAIDGISGWHTSAVREAIIPAIKGRVPYTYPAQYEGGEHARNVYCIGETPTQQVEPAMRWLKETSGISRWAIVGDDYIWPRKTTTFIESLRDEMSISISSECFLTPDQMTTTQLRNVVRDIADSRPDGVMVLMVGQHAALFNREFSRQGHQDTIVRFCPLIEENTLLASGIDTTRNLYTAGGYFPTLPTEESLALLERFVKHKGLYAPVIGSTAEACYEGILALRAIAEDSDQNSAGTDRTNPADNIGKCFSFNSPRGAVSFTTEGASQKIYIARASNFNFDVLDVIA